ncbi:Uncharacterised protein [Legionella cincinnatiensis]|uniref:Uncharacterized protein n=1 Tax=Legionella cincinnatiensis TaxID=28085 RepID=A0A378II70_9GAMM|nr:Uncharacterised protein [Legionella cincinnatiensis]
MRVLNPVHRISKQSVKESKHKSECVLDMFNNVGIT